MHMGEKFKNRMLDALPGSVRKSDGSATLAFDAISVNQEPDGKMKVSFVLNREVTFWMTSENRFGPGDTLTIGGIDGAVGVALA